MLTLSRVRCGAGGFLWGIGRAVAPSDNHDFGERRRLGSTMGMLGEEVDRSPEFR